MAELVVIGLLLVVVLYLLAMNGRLREYKGTHAFTKADVEQARKQSVSGSRSVTSGKIQEHLAPMFPEFAKRFNLGDARFIGAPIDYIVFSGLSEDRVDEIVFLDVKTGQARLSKRQRAIRDAVNDRRVSFEILKLDSAGRYEAEETLSSDDKVEDLGSFESVAGRLVQVSSD